MSSIMADNKPRVLVISSVDPYIGPGIVGLQHYNALKKGGLDVDFLTKYPVKDHPEFISVYGRYPNRIETFIAKIKKTIKKTFHLDSLVCQEPTYFFFYKNEILPEVPVEKVIAKIEKEYDIVYILFWQGLLSFATINALYDKLKCQFQFRCVDYSPMAGGCHFTGDCQRYKTGCGCCPGIKSHKESDFTRWNVQYRQKVYKKVKPIVYGNSYMNTFYRKSYLLKDYDRLEVVYPLMDNNVFQPLDMATCRSQYNIPNEKEFVIFFGCQGLNDERKGISFLLDALNFFHNCLTVSERKKILLVIAGRNIEEIQDSLKFDYKYLGYVSLSELPSIYSMSNVYLSPTVNDAGPSMVNQSLSCGTPVIAFEMGTALDVVKNQGTGYCAELRNVEDFANGIEHIFRMERIDYNRMREKCRELALSLTSEKAFVDRFLMTYMKYK